jgi:GT2 family glycosyltransferase
MPMPEVAVIVLNYNGMQFLEKCFDSLRKSTYPAIQLLMYDNRSTDESVDFIRLHYPEVKIIRSFINGGYSRAYNEAIQHTSAPYAVLLNNDVEVEPGWIEPLVARAESDSGIGALQPKLVWLLDRSRFEYAGSAGGEMDKYGYPFLRGRIFNTIEYDTGQYDDEKDIFWASGAALFVRTSVFGECLALDETFVHHMEEIDMCWRIHLLGYRIRVVPASVVAHYGGATIVSDSFKKMYWNHRNSMFMLFKNLGKGNLAGILMMHAFFDLAAILQSVLNLTFKRAVAIIYAYLWLFINLPLLLTKRKEVQRLRKVDDASIMQKLFPRSVAIAYFVGRKRTYAELTKADPTWN